MYMYIICSSNHIHVGAQQCCCYYVQCSLSVYTNTHSQWNQYSSSLPPLSLPLSLIPPALPLSLPPGCAEQGRSALTIKINFLTALLVSLVPPLTQYPIPYHPPILSLSLLLLSLPLILLFLYLPLILLFLSNLLYMQIKQYHSHVIHQVRSVCGRGAGMEAFRYMQERRGEESVEHNIL